ncbi:hypothetical protein ACFL6U_00885 [Planctomycetota bacterium]
MRRNRTLLVSMVSIILVVLLTVLLLRPEPKALYTVTFLPSLGGGRSSLIPQSINDDGRVVGVTEISANQWHMFIWDANGGIRDLGPCVYRRPHDDPVRINNTGHIVGTTVDPNGNKLTFLMDPNGVKHIVHAPNGERVHVNALNQSGQVVGYLNPEQGARVAFVWDQINGMQDLAPPNAIESLACGINDAGQVVGFLSTQRNNKWYAFLWDPDTGMQNLGIARFGPTDTCHINNQGWVVGRFGSADNDTTVSVWTRERGVQTAPALRGTFARVVGLNDTNYFIVCMDRNALKIRQSTIVPDKVSFLCDPNGVIRDLAGCLDCNDVAQFMATGMNNRGQIIGLLQTKKQPDALGVILEPVK